MPQFTLKLVSPLGSLFAGDVESVVVPGETGFVGVLAGHAPMLAALQPGVMSVTESSGTIYFAVGTGLLEIDEGGVVVLADEASAADSEADAKSRVTELKQKASES